MTFYEIEISKLKHNVYANQAQLDTVIGTRNYINNHYDTDLNLDLLSHIRFTSKFHLLRLFKKFYGQTPKQYLTDKRLEKSKEYLKKGMTITDTCFAIGFESASSFSTLFKSRTGLTPTEFQKEQLSQSLFNADAETLSIQSKI
ncbi:MAG: helix-turn-helix domain-containing protein [Agriterribacter sp.]